MMSFAIVNQVGAMMLLRWVHILVGVVWLGTLYYFCFIHSELAVSPQKLKRVFWFATSTLISGLFYIAGSASMSFYSSWGICMLIGSGLGILMWLNLLFVISPQIFLRNQKTTSRSEVLLRNNLMLSIPMLFFMSSASHLGIDVNPHSAGWPLFLGISVVLMALEINAFIGKRAQITSTKKAVISGVALMTGLYFAVEFLTK